jgi:outer membrane receptor protein involved in Fe transport
VYPAEAFLYGGRAFLVLPPGLKEYRTRQGNPETQFGLNATYQLDNGLGFTLSANRFSKVHSGRLQLVELPETEVVNLGVFWEQDNWRVKLDVFNATDERYFRARSGDTLGDALVSAMPERRWQLTLTSDF